MNPSISIIGYGRLGKLFYKAFESVGFDSISAVKKNERISSLSDVNLICVPDGEIRKVILGIAESGIHPAGKIIAHCSGTIGLDVFKPISDSGVIFGCLHPLMAVTEHSNSFSGITFDVCGSEDFVQSIQPITESLKADIIIVDEDEKARLHIAAVIVSNYLVTLMGAGKEALSASNTPGEQFQKALLPLMRSVLDNLESQSPGEALTGPIARSDHQTVQRHLEILADHPALETLYSVLGRETLRMLEQEGKQTSNLLKRLFDEAGNL